MLAVRGASQTRTRAAAACGTSTRSSRRNINCAAYISKKKTQKGMQMAPAEVLACQQQLLDSIDQGDYSVYKELCSTDITCFEPESKGHLVEGLPFHQFFFDLPSGQGAKQSTISSPHVRILGGGNVAVISYVRLQQSHDAATGLKLGAVQETRVWEKQAGGSWKCVHLHRSTEAK